MNGASCLDAGTGERGHSSIRLNGSLHEIGAAFKKGIECSVQSEDEQNGKQRDKLAGGVQSLSLLVGIGRLTQRGSQRREALGLF